MPASSKPSWALTMKRSSCHIMLPLKALSRRKSVYFIIFLPKSRSIKAKLCFRETEVMRDM